MIENIIFVEKPTYKRFRDLTNQKFGRWSVLGYAGVCPVGKTFQSFWWVQCACPDKTIKKVNARSLLNNDSSSCGCWNIESLINRSVTHGMTKSSEYNSYRHAKERCEDINNYQYCRYGGRGIEFRFNSFEEFYAELGDKPEPKKNHSVERINNDRHYEVGNVKWAQAREQARNTRQNRIVTINGESYCLAEWGEIMNISNKTIDRRLNKYNWCEECSIMIPVDGGKCIHI